MITEKVTCDRCDEECDIFFAVDIAGENFYCEYELCQRCKDKLKNWLND